MDAEDDVLGKNDINDVRWLCSLTDSELDLLIGLKNLVQMRAVKIGHEALAKKFDLHMLRTFSFIFMEHLKGQLKDVPVAPDFDSNLLKQNLSGSFARMTIEDLYPYICSGQRKRMTDWDTYKLKNGLNKGFFRICLPPKSKKLTTDVSKRLVQFVTLDHPLPVLSSLVVVFFSNMYIQP